MLGEVGMVVLRREGGRGWELTRLGLGMLGPLLLLLLLLVMWVTGRARLLVLGRRIRSSVLRSIRLRWLLGVVAIGGVMGVVIGPGGRLVIMTVASSSSS